MLRENEQVVLRKHAESALVDTCTIKRRTASSDSAGGRVSTSDSTVATGVKARLSPVRNDFEQERVIAESLGAQVSWILSVPIGTDIKLNDYVTMTGYSGRLEVRAILTAPRSIKTVIRVVVMETK